MIGYTFCLLRSGSALASETDTTPVSVTQMKQGEYDDRSFDPRIQKPTRQTSFSIHCYHPKYSYKPNPECGQRMFCVDLKLKESYTLAGEKFVCTSETGSAD